MVFTDVDTMWIVVVCSKTMSMRHDFEHTTSILVLVTNWVHDDIQLGINKPNLQHIHSQRTKLEGSEHKTITLQDIWDTKRESVNDKPNMKHKPRMITRQT